MTQGTRALLAAAALAAASTCWIACGSEGAGGSTLLVPSGPPPPQLPTSAEGWTELAPSADSRLVYVSNTTGSDANDGLSPATPKSSIAAGVALLRTGMPDWLHLKSGDVWTGEDLGSWAKSGRNTLEPIVVTSYDTGARPRLRTGTSTALFMGALNVLSHIAFVGLHFEAHTSTG